MTVSNVNVSAATISTYIYVATGGETSKSGADSNGASLSYTPGKEQVYLNGGLLVRGTDYTATDGSSITSLTALAASDILEVIAFSPFNVANAVQASNFAAKGDLVAGTGSGTFSNVTVGTNGQYLQADSTQTAGVKWATVATIPYTPSALISSNTTLVAFNSYFIDTTAARTLTLPASATLGDEIHIFDVSGTAFTNNITVANNGLNIRGSAQSLTINVNYAAVVLVYLGATYGWRVS